MILDSVANFVLYLKIVKASREEDFGNSPWLVGLYCSYLLPKQALTTFSYNRNRTLRQSG